jgi:uncharacterized protein (UPF0216 family)
MNQDEQTAIDVLNAAVPINIRQLTREEALVIYADPATLSHGTLRVIRKLLPPQAQVIFVAPGEEVHVADKDTVSMLTQAAKFHCVGSLLNGSEDALKLLQDAEQNEFADMPHEPWIGRMLRKVIRGKRIPPSTKTQFLKLLVWRADYLCKKAAENGQTYQNDMCKRELEALSWAIQTLAEILKEEKPEVAPEAV